MLKIKGLKLPMIADEIVTGNVRFVDSGGTKTLDDPNYGGDPEKTFATWDYAIGKMTADNGDYLIILPAHAENIALTTTVDIDVAGITHIGLGQGSNRPTFTQTATDAYVDVAAANTKFRNLYFKGGVNTGTVAMVNIGAKNVLIDMCEFKNISALLHTDYFIQTSGAANACDYLRILNCLFNSQTTGDCHAAIWLEEVEDSVLIKGNIILGAYDDAGIFVAGAKTCTMLRIEDNTIENTEAGDWAIEVASASTGFCTNNRMYTNSFATMLDPGSLKCSGNKGSIAVDMEGVAVPGVGGSDIRLATKAYTVVNGEWDTVDTPDFFTVTGTVLARAFGEVTTNFTSASNTGTISLGSTDSAAALIPAATADGTELQAGDIWFDATSGSDAGALPDDGSWVALCGTTVQATIATKNVTAGAVTVYMQWIPMSADGNVVAA